MVHGFCFHLLIFVLYLFVFKFINIIERMSSEGRKLFKYYIDQNQQNLASRELFQYRVNRWRYNTQDL
jgi:hypothetical protein